MLASPGAADSNSVLARLRRDTRDQHEALDRSLSVGGLTQARYVALLSGSLAVLEQLEPRIARLLPEFSSERIVRLRQDLALLSANALPDAQAPAIDEHADAWGAAYVVEGSALGGIALAKTARRDQTIDPRALSYLELRGAGTFPHWKEFVARLSAWGDAASESEQERACATARATFDAYARAIAAAGQP